MFSHHLIDILQSFNTWVVIGMIGQFMFTMRFVVQWLASEKEQKSVVPVSFWFFSIAGGAIVLAYAIHKGDPVFIIGQGGGLLIYLRNIYFVVNERRKTASSSAA
ncbi:MAG: hypothetical protein DI586_07530 [Micavibrio aeruginosavorus]|uniref:Lipid A biosynthesis N-terminal domain-containing protein n=1 Tax=Micavibrio aeruginosavorus TaxID=349221 RepID=A0A2W5FIY7_9BACT|nr:MAG: hypothetical protein DI586_07530 [Micavibrio aeruginosavorus]